MRRLLAVSAVLLSIVLVVPSRGWAQMAEIDLGRSKGALGKIDSSTELKEATFDFKEPKLLFTLPGSSKREEEPIEGYRLPRKDEDPIGDHGFPWAVRPDVPYRITAEKKKNGNVVLSNPRLEFVAKWDDAKANLMDNASVAKLDKVMNEIPEGALSIPDAVRPKLEQATVSAIASLPPDKPERKSLVDVYYLQQKSYHGNRQIPFTVFEKAGKTCLAACAVRRDGKPNPHGSGVLVGKSLVMTCAHNFTGTNGPAEKCQVLFHFTGEDQGAAFKIARLYYSSPNLDFCLLELGGQSRPADDPAFNVLPDPPKLGVQPELEQYTGIYVAGYPQGNPLSVALNSQVVYPFWIDTEQRLTDLIAWAVLRMFVSAADYEAYKDTYTPRVQKYFQSNYNQEAGQTGFFFRPQDEPTIGADPDTKHGDSGAPAFDIERNAVIGLLRAGAPDDASFPAGANYENFEAIIPMSQIVAELEQAKPGWKTQFGVTYFGD